MIKSIFKNSLLYLILGFICVWFFAPFVPIQKIIAPIKDHKTLAISIFMTIIISFTVISMFFQFAIVYQLVKFIKNWKRALILMGISLVLIFLCIVWMQFSLEKAKAFTEGISYFDQLKIIIFKMGLIALPQKCFYSLFIIFLCTGFGYLISLIIREKNLLVPVMLCCVLVDIWTVTLGFVSKTLTNTPEVLSAVSSEIPMVGSRGFNPISTIGAGDFIFPALVFACVFKFGFEEKKNFWLMFSFLLIGMLLIILNIVPILPALVFVSAAALTANWKKFNLTKKEILYTVIVFLFLLTYLILFTFFTK